MRSCVLACLTAALLMACGGKGGGGSGGGDPDAAGGGGGGDPDGGGGGGLFDAPIFSGVCTPGGPQCANCIDDDDDKKIDGFDLECTGPADNDEGSFATGIPGDNKDRVDQDCFFDGDSGAGNDGCSIHVCCLLGITKKADCPIGQSRFDPSQCPPPIGSGVLSPKCIENCGKVTPPGCDCFGCCTLCNGTTCVEVNINQAVSPDCTPEVLTDPTKCKTCTKSTACAGPTCNDETCVLCPGEDPSMLPGSCSGTSSCPDGQTACPTGNECPMSTYCSNGCCLGVIQ